MINFSVDFDAAGEIAGTVAGMQSSFESEFYLDNLARAAHRLASRQFDLATAGAAQAGLFNHVYEFGVTGITRGPTRFADPTRPEARLYVHNMVGHGGDFQINYAFRPAIVPNPKPTVKHTGVPTKYLRKLSNRRYVFWNRANVMETGMSVEIYPKNGRYLFVPFYGEPSETGNRTYMMWDAERNGPITANPGRETRGSFTSFFEAWWSGTGTGIMSKQVEQYVLTDVEASLRAASSRAASILPVPAASARTGKNYQKAFNQTKRAMAKNAKSRAGRKRD